ncbi:MAG: TldD/PmbA family protein [Microbacter sp.]
MNQHLNISSDTRTTSTIQDIMARFGVSREDLTKVLQTAMSTGGDFADLFFEHTFDSKLSLRDGEVNAVGANIDFGMGVRVVNGDQTGYAYTENITLEEMMKAAKTASRIAVGTGSDLHFAFQASPRRGSFYPLLHAWEKAGVDMKQPFLQRLNERIFSLSEHVSKVLISQTNTMSYVLYANSDGVLSFDERPMGTLSVTCIMERNGQVENGRAARAFRMGSEFLTNDLIETLAQEVVAQTLFLFDAVTPKGGEMPVVMAAGGSGILLHEAIGHAFEADFNRKQISIFSDKLGQKICDTSISVVDDGTIPYNRGAVNMDDEGIEGQKTYLVKDGILTNYLHDRISARHYGVMPTGNGRRQSFRFAPIPRMRATYMENGQAKEEDLIASVSKGIYVDSFTNGQVQIGAGDFTFFVKKGYLIENGKLTQPVKDINIIGNGPKALADIQLVAGNYQMDNGTWTCGKDGQSCPVTCGMPSVLVSKLTVGGSGDFLLSTTFFLKHYLI